MSWDEAYKQLEQELGRQPNNGEVQERMLEIAESKITKQQYVRPSPQVLYVRL